MGNPQEKPQRIKDELTGNDPHPNLGPPGDGSLVKPGAPENHGNNPRRTNFAALYGDTHSTEASGTTTGTESTRQQE